ncbi:MAG: alpha/beta hydrolase [Rhodoblastus sp.]
MTTPLDPAIAEILPLLPLRDPDTMTPQSARDSLVAMARARPPLQSSAEISPVSLRGAEGQIPARVYRVAAAPSATVVFFHGGGWVAGDLETHERQAQLLAMATGAVVVSVDYRRPPEAPFPAAFADCFAALKDIAARIGDFGGDTRRIGVAGDSAGGNLAAACAIAARDAGLALCGQLLAYPVTDVTGLYADAAQNAHYPSRRENASGYFLTLATMAWFARHYLGAGASGDDWRVSPLRAKNLAGVAPAVVCTAFFDPLRDEGQAYADALEAAGVETTRHHGHGLIHGYFGMGEASAAAKAEAQRAWVDFKRLLDRGA